MSQDETRATTLHFSIKPLDNWAYQNVGYAPDNIFGWEPNNAVEMFPNEFANMSMVYGMIAQPICAIKFYLFSISLLEYNQT